MSKTPPFPVQPVVRDPEGVVRFRVNRVVRAFMEAARDGKQLDLNAIASAHIAGQYTREELVQFAQLIGYSVSGWSDLSYVTDRDYAKAQRLVQRLEDNEEEEKSNASSE